MKPVFTVSERAVFELHRRWGEVMGKHSQCWYTDSRTLATWEEPETSGGQLVQDLKEDITIGSLFDRKSFQCLYCSCECCSEIQVTHMKTLQLRSKFIWGRIIKIGSIRVQIGPIGFYLDRNLSTAVREISTARNCRRRCF